MLELDPAQTLAHVCRDRYTEGAARLPVTNEKSKRSATRTKLILNMLEQKDHQDLLGARVRHSACGKGHKEGGSTYAKAGSSLRSPPGNPRASTPMTRACLLYYFVLPPTPLTLRGAVPHHLFRRRS